MRKIFGCILRIEDDDQFITQYYTFEGPLLRAGDDLRVNVPFTTLAGEHYDRGDVLHVVERTLDVPFKLLAAFGNLRIVGKDGRETVWSSVELMLAHGIIHRRGARGKVT